MKEDTHAEFSQGIDRKNLGLYSGHWGPFIGQVLCVDGLARTLRLDELAISILAARKTIGQALAGVKRRCRRAGKPESSLLRLNKACA
jgi:hypothetical protein